jgi:hypothetical protein
MSITACKNKSTDGLLIITEAPGKIQNPDFATGDSWRFIPGVRITAIDPDEPGSSEILTGKFYSACYPEISYDGKYMLFAAQQKEGDTWQIWEMELGNREARKITSFKSNCADPAYLPGNRMVFTGFAENDTVKKAYCLYTCNLDGSAVQQITFGPSAGFATTVLKDGRLLIISRQLFPALRDPMLTVMRPDGTKADMFCKCAEGSSIVNRARETADGKILFIEKGKDPYSEGDLISVSYNRPLHTRINLTSGTEGSFNSVLPLRSGIILVSYSKPGSDHFALYELSKVDNTPGKAIYDNPEYNVLDVVEALKYERPKKLPSEVDKGVKTGLLLCQDINVLYRPVKGDLPSFSRADRIEVLGIDSTYGVLEVEKDGSFYLKVMADTPFRIRTLDKNGSVLNGPCAWLWLRPNERRGCVGCHEDPELVPENRVPDAVRKSPVIIPVHVSKIREKIVELE